MEHSKSLALAALIATLLAGFIGLPAVAHAQNVVTVSGDITSDTTWTPDNIYVLSGAVFVLAPATLTIEAGTTIAGESATNGTLIIARDARIVARGTADAPIVMTSDQGPGSRARGQWGGLIINGRAPLNVPGGEAFGEGDTGVYGGNQRNDDSGVLRYVRVEFAGTEFSPDNELNGIAFQGVGRNTEVDFVQVHFNKDDGIEFFGGTVEVKHAICTGIADDSFDWTDGWTGNGQFWIAQQRGDDADQGIEADNNAENNNLTPRSSPTLYNVTLIGDPDTKQGDESDIGILLREGTAGTLRNFIVQGFKETGLEIDDTATFQQAASGALSLGNSIFWQNGPPQFSDDADEDPAPPFTTAEFAARSTAVVVVNPRLIQPFKFANPNFRPAASSPAVDGTIAVAVPPNNGFFEVTTFIGALSSDPAQDWTRGWTTAVQR